MTGPLCDPEAYWWTSFGGIVRFLFRQTICACGRCCIRYGWMKYRVFDDELCTLQHRVRQLAEQVTGRRVVELHFHDSIENACCLIVVRGREREHVGKHVQQCQQRNIPVYYLCDASRAKVGEYGRYGVPSTVTLIVFSSITDALYQLTPKLQSLSVPLYRMVVDGEECWLPLHEAGIVYDNGYIRVEIGGTVRASGQERPISPEEVQQIRQIADEYSASK